MKRKQIVCFVLFVLLCFSGCAGTMKNATPIRTLKVTATPGTGAEQAVQPVNMQPQAGKPVHEATDSISRKTLSTGALVVAEVKEPAVENINPATKDAPVKSNRSRFEKVKKEINSSRFSSTKKKNTAGNVSFNFDNADLYEVIRTMAEILKINYIVDSVARGKVTIHTAGQLDKSDLLPLFHQILELNGLAALKEGSLYRIVNKDKIPNIPILSRFGRDLEDIPLHERLVMQIIPLDYISPKAIIPTITPFLSNSGKIITPTESDLFIVIDKSSNLKRILQLVDVFDVDVFNDIEHRFFRLSHIESAEMADLISELMGPYLKVDQSEFKIISIDRLNTIVAISGNSRVLEKMADFIDKIDAEENSAAPRIFIYKVKNSDAEELASLLNQVFREEDAIAVEKNGSRNQVNDSSQKDAPTKLFVQPETEKKTPGKALPLITTPSNGMGGGSSLSDEIKIIADTTRNALIIEAVPSDYVIVKRILQELDVMPRQVLIDVVILDVNITDSQTLGVEWSFLKDRPGGDSGLLSGSFGSTTRGLTFTAGLTDDWITAVKALAVEDRADVLSAPSVLASDNKPATINVVTQIPVTTSSYDSDNGVTTTTVQYRDTGIILTVTPQINDDGMVSMDIRQEVSSVVDSSSDAANPSFFNRNIQTTLSVRDKQTLAIGGLISETKGDNSSGVPFLSSLPVIGFLFGEKKDSIIKNELIIMITPRVISGLSDIDSVSKEFKSKFTDLETDHQNIGLYSDQ